MTILITGAGGFVGRYATAYFKEKYPDDKILEADIRGTDLAINLLDKDKVRALIKEEKPSKILHLAGKSSVGLSLKEPMETFEANIGSFLNIMEAVRLENLTPKVVLVSSSDVYGVTKTQANARLETDCINPGSPYAASKAALELIGRQYYTHFGIKTIIARPFNHTGPGHPDVFVLPSFAKQLTTIRKTNGDPVLYTGNIEVERDFLDVRDVVRAYYMLFEKGKSGETYNICSGGALPIRWMLEEMISLCGIHVEVRNDASLSRKNDMPILVGSNEKLKQDTGWQPEIPISETLKGLIEYWEKK
ncbi:MAG: GDP-mannose 4,6-dehydratase [Fibrobacteres bacterium]|nr:GDP-mannose 4,6-dehydratase [Fibrobacterota bacterium]